jgi:hypothetical protein
MCRIIRTEDVVTMMKLNANDVQIIKVSEHTPEGEVLRQRKILADIVEGIDSGAIIEKAHSDLCAFFILSCGGRMST